MSVETARAHLARFGRDQDILLLDQSSATVELAAQALGTEGRRIAKTLSFGTKEGPILIVAAGDARIDNAAYKAFFHEKAKMLSPEEVLLRAMAFIFYGSLTNIIVLLCPSAALL